MLFPHKDEVLEIQRQLIDRFGGIHGIRNPSTSQPLRFIAFLYHTS